MTRQLATMTKAGIPIIKSFDVFIIGIRKHPRLKILAIKIKQAIEGGDSFSKALSNFPKIFDKLYVGLITAGMTGILLTFAVPAFSAMFINSGKPFTCNYTIDC